MDATQQFCTFFLEGNLFGVPVSEVQEVIQLQQITPVPLAMSVEGMINLRGQIVVAIDLRQRLHLKTRGSENVPLNVVVRTGEGPVSLLVDEIGDVMEVEAASFEEPPETMPPSVRGIVLGVHKLEGRLLHVLDTEQACRVQTAAET